MMSPGLFRVVSDGQYHLAYPESGIEFTVDYLRRERNELVCELAVSCGIIGARVFDGCLSIGTFNLSSPQARSSRAKLLADRARARGIDWGSMLEELAQRVLTAERTGAPAISLRDVPEQAADNEHEVLGLRFPASHPSIVFGDGGTMKSFLALKVAAHLAESGLRVGFFDWELDKFTHRRRLGMMSGPEMSDVRYVRCDRPLIHEVTRLRRSIQQEKLDYAVFDSIGYGTQGAPESAEAAMDYCRALRQLGIGSLLLAHITKAETGDQRPFGSVFWHNSARSTWNIKRASTSPDGQTVNLAAFHRKSNLGPQRSAIGLAVTFDVDCVRFQRMDATSIDEIAESLPLWQRIKGVIKTGPQTLATIAAELNYDKVESLDRVVRKHKTLFQKVPGGDGITRIALLERRAS